MHPKRYNDRKTEAARVGVSERTLERRCKEDGFPFIRLGSRLLFDPQLTDEFLAQRVHRSRAAELAQQAA